MNCARARAAMHLEIDHELDRAGREQLTEHIASCSTCRLEYDQLSAVTAGLGWLARQSADVPAQHTHSVRRFVLGGAGLAAAAMIALSAMWLAGPVVPNTTRVSAPSLARVRLSAAMDARFIAVQRESTMPRVHVVWLYEVERSDTNGSSDARDDSNLELAKRS